METTNSEGVKKIYIAYEDGRPCKYGYAFVGYNKDKNEYDVIHGHMSTDEGFVQIDMGLYPGSDERTGKKARDIYDKTYPNGYELIWFGLIGSEHDEKRLQDLLLQQTNENFETNG